MSSSGPELVFGLVGALGTDLGRLAEVIQDRLAEFRYEAVHLRLSDLLREFPEWRSAPVRPHDERIKALQDAGNALRARTGRGGAMAALALTQIKEHRRRRGGDAKKPAVRTAYVLRSLKHPDEAALLREIYGPAFVLVAAYAPLEQRRSNLAREIARSRGERGRREASVRAEELIQRDYHEPDRSDGQLVRDTFPLADVFIPVHRPQEIPREVSRFLELLFGHPCRTPTKDEFAMFQAQAAALRSADLSRQVGAAILTPRGEIVALGTNEVPKGGGGQYWTGDEGDARDYHLGRNESLRIRSDMLTEILLRMKTNGWLESDVAASLERDVDEFVANAVTSLSDTTLMAVGEFGRTVHAEMSALLDAARRGVAVDRCALFTTTFPCHNCTKHIAAAGISRVVYIAPYPKSRAEELHGDSIVVDSTSPVAGRVNFEPFVGLAPRRYTELFSMPDRENADGSVRRFDASDAMPRVPTTTSYVEVESMAIAELADRLDRAGLRAGSARD